MSLDHQFSAFGQQLNDFGLKLTSIGDILLAMQHTIDRFEGMHQTTNASILRLEGRLTNLESRVTGMHQATNDSITRLEGRLTNIESRVAGMDNKLASTERRIETMVSFPHVVKQPVAEWCASRNSVSGSDREVVRYLR